MWKNVDRIAPRLYDKGEHNHTGGYPRRSNAATLLNNQNARKGLRTPVSVVRKAAGSFPMWAMFNTGALFLPEQHGASGITRRGLVMSKSSNLFASNYHPTSISPEDDVVMAIIKTRAYLAFIKDMLADDWKPREVMLSGSKFIMLRYLIDTQKKQRDKCGVIGFVTDSVTEGVTDDVTTSVTDSVTGGEL